MSRRLFLGQVAGTVALGAGGCWAATAGSDDAWAFPLLGDLHIDRPEHHDADWLKANHPGDVRQVENYSRVTREWTPKLFETVREQTARIKLPVPFVAQLGDLIEGLCGSEERAAIQARDAIAMLKDLKLPAPLLFCKGNHDVTGPGAAAVYDRLLVPFMGEQAGREISEARFTRTRGGTLLVFYDAYDRGSLDWFEALLRDRKPDRLLFLIHPPVVPFTARSTWHIYFSPKQKAERDRLLSLLGLTRAVVLCGHLHKYGFLVRRTEAGKFAQLSISSVATDAMAKAKDLLEGVERYSPDLVKLEPSHSPDTADARKAVLAAEKPWIEHFEYADTWGHAVITVGPGGVRADVCRGLDRTAWKSLDLTAPLR